VLRPFSFSLPSFPLGNSLKGENSNFGRGFYDE
jgi:hypothetical protein